jgi:hypothetical protein
MAKYDPKQDPQFQKPYTDKDEWRERDTGVAVRYQYIHGGFEGTEARFSFFFPPKETYQGRFFHFMAPVQGSEDASESGRDSMDPIAFAVSHGAYFVETNMGVAVPFAPIEDPTVIYRSSAAAAEYSRKIAAKIYGPHRPFGYIFGGSGGGFKSTSCLENTAAWDGAAPFVIGSPVAIPNCFTVRAHAKRLLRRVFPRIADAIEPGGGDMYEGLNEEEREALEEVTRMGFPPRVWFMYKTLDDGALPLLTPAVTAIDKTYYEDFWTVPGYLGTDPNGSARRDRIQHKTETLAVHIPHREGAKIEHKTGVDEAWQSARGDQGADSRPWITLKDTPKPLREGDIYLAGAYITVLSGEAEGYRFPLESLSGNTAYIGAGFGQTDMLDKLAAVKTGDGVMLDNSDYIAIQTYHRHQVPDASFAVWDQFRDKSGAPLYPQRPVQVGPLIAAGGAGSLQSGDFEGKMIVVAALMDESALPWQPDWYRRRVREALVKKGIKEEERFRLWYIDHALHGEPEKTTDDLHLVSYLGALNQALLDLAAWVEKGVAPPESIVYTVKDGQVSVPEEAPLRKGIQPVVNLKANGSERADARPGEEVHFEAEVELPPDTGKLVSAEWSFEGEENYPVKGFFSNMDEAGESARVRATHCFEKPGTYFPVLRISSNRNGAEQKTGGDGFFTQVKNLCRVRVVVK